MRLQRTQWVRFLSPIIVLFVAAGCFQPAGSSLEATSMALSAPTYTLEPSETPTPAPTRTPTEAPPTDQPTITPSLSIEGTRIVDVSVLLAQQDPIVLTATALAIQSQTTPFAVQPIATNTPFLDPLALTATAIVGGATQTAAAPLTATAAALLGIPVGTPGVLQPGATPAPTGLIATGTDCIHEVQPTDRNLFRISLQYGVTVEQIATASNIANPNLIYVGQRLVIPGCGTTGFRPPPTSIPTASAQSGGLVATAVPSGRIHVVRQNETLFQLSLLYGPTVHEIAAANGITNINLIYIGQELIIP